MPIISRYAKQAHKKPKLPIHTMNLINELDNALLSATYDLRFFSPQIDKPTEQVLAEYTKLYYKCFYEFIESAKKILAEYIAKNPSKVDFALDDYNNCLRNLIDLYRPKGIDVV